MKKLIRRILHGLVDYLECSGYVFRSLLGVSAGSQSTFDHYFDDLTGDDSVVATCICHVSVSLQLS